MSENLSKGDAIQAINSIYDTDREERIKHPKLRIALAAIITILILITPAIILVITAPNLSPEQSKSIGIWVYVGIFAIIAAILLVRRSIMINKFISVKNTKNVFIQTELKNPEDFKPIITADAIVYPGDLDDMSIDLIYNWLRYRKVLKESAPHLYSFTGRSLRDATRPGIQVIDRNKYYAICLADLDTSNPEFKKVIKEHNIIARSAWLQSIVG